MIHQNLTHDASAAALAEAATKYEAARKLAADVDTRHAEASAALLAATEIQAGLAARIASGQGVAAKEAGAAAAAIVVAREHLALIDGAKAIAATACDGAEREFLDARYSHEINVIREKRRDLAGKQRAMAQKALDYAQSVEECRDAGESMLILT